MARQTKVEREHANSVAEQVVAGMYEGIERNADDWRRGHLGASIIGHRCDRYLWLSFRWAMNPKHDGKQLRLFERGQREEPAIVRDLQAAGMQVLQHDPGTGEQWEVLWGHVAGSGDALIWGVPGLDPKEKVLGEFKTSNKKNFEYLKSKRVRSAKPEHYVQMQLYMAGLGLKHALYIVICKDTDEYYVELVDYNDEVVEKHLFRAQAIVEAKAPPERMDPDFPPCVYVSKDGTRWPCDFYELCHGQAMPERNCRTCVEVTPVMVNGAEPAWTCKLGRGDDQYLTLAEQKMGCEEQCSIPPIVNAQPLTVAKRQVTYQFADGKVKTEVARGTATECACEWTTEDPVHAPHCPLAATESKP